MGYRKINVNGEEWRWKVGWSNVSIRGPNNQSFAPFKDELSEIQDVERAEWKGYFHITPAHIRAFILKVSETSDLDLAPILKDVFYEKKGAEYAGGTLAVKIDDELQLLNVGDGKTDEEKFWIALNYLKYKNDRCMFYTLADSIVRSSPIYKSKKLLAIALLKASN